MAVETRTYAKSETAKAAMDELLSQGFSEVNASFKPDRARVDVDAPFGEGQRVAQILDRHGPLGPDDERSAGEPNARAGVVGKVTDWAAPLSSLLGWKVLSDYRSPFWPQALVHDPAPLSTRLGWPVLCGPTRSAAPPRGHRPRDGYGRCVPGRGRRCARRRRGRRRSARTRRGQEGSQAALDVQDAGPSPGGFRGFHSQRVRLPRGGRIAFARSR